MDAIIIPAIQQGVLFLPLCFGLYLTYRIMVITDLTVEATFVTGAGVFARLVTSHHSELTALLIALLISAGVGLSVAVMQRLAKLDALITSILAIFMMYSVNLTLMGRPNISLLQTHTLIQQLDATHPVLLWSGLIVMVAIIAIGLIGLLHSRVGLLFRTFGDNRQLLQQLNVSDFLILSTGLIISNTLAALSGILTAQINGYADINMSPGVALTAIGAVIVGLTLVNTTRFNQGRYLAPLECIGCIMGVFLYFIVMNGLLVAGVDPIYLKCLLGLLLLMFLSSRQFTTKEVRPC